MICRQCNATRQGTVGLIGANRRHYGSHDHRDFCLGLYPGPNHDHCDHHGLRVVSRHRKSTGLCQIAYSCHPHRRHCPHRWTWSKKCFWEVARIECLHSLTVSLDVHHVSARDHVSIWLLPTMIIHHHHQFLHHGPDGHHGSADRLSIHAHDHQTDEARHPLGLCHDPCSDLCRCLSMCYRVPIDPGREREEVTRTDRNNSCKAKMEW